MSKEEKAARSALWKLKRAAAAERRKLKEVRDGPAKAVRDSAQAYLARIRAARTALSRQNAEDAVAKYESRLARLAAAEKRARLRRDLNVFGKRPEPVVPKRPEGMSKQEWKAEKAKIRKAPPPEPTLHEKWSHVKSGATPETLEKAQHANHEGTMRDLRARGAIDAEQEEWAAEIANVYRSIESGVTIGIASLEARVDNSSSGRAHERETSRRVRLHLAYDDWRSRLPAPKALILDMLTGDQVGYTVAATRHHVGHRRAKRLLIEAIDLWPVCVDRSYRVISEAYIRAINDMVY